MKLEDQRNKAMLHVSETIPAMNMFTCAVHGCRKVLRSTTFLDSFRKAIDLTTEWPPSFSSNTVRSILDRIQKAGDVNLGPTALCQHRPAIMASLPEDVMHTAQVFEDFADRVNEQMAGMCLTCVKNDGSYNAGPCRTDEHWHPVPGWKDEL